MVLYEDNKAKYDAVSKDLFRLVQRDEKIHDVEFKTKPIGFFMDVWLRFVKNKASVIAAVIILIISFFAVFGPGMNEYTYDEQHTELTNMPPKVPFIAKMNLGFFDGGYTMENRKYDNLNDPEKYPEGCILEVINPRLVNGERIVDVVVDYYKYKGLSDEQCFWFGSDYLGRDIWTRMWRGARVSLIIAVVSVCCNVFRLLRRKGGHGDDAYHRDHQRLPQDRCGDPVHHGVWYGNVLHHHVLSHQGLGEHGPYGPLPVLPVQGA